MNTYLSVESTNWARKPRIKLHFTSILSGLIQKIKITLKALYHGVKAQKRT